ncbi:MAG: hypothetical protein II091_02150, partial [Lachnospiraceae bacterium]|nr:hypothetical protein [Lachnospiraceae bacterium]
MLLDTRSVLLLLFAGFAGLYQQKLVLEYQGEGIYINEGGLSYESVHNRQNQKRSLIGAWRLRQDNTG